MQEGHARHFPRSLHRQCQHRGSPKSLPGGIFAGGAWHWCGRRGWFTQLGAAHSGDFLPPLSAADLMDLCRIRDHLGRREGGKLVISQRVAVRQARVGECRVMRTYWLTGLDRRRRMNSREKKCEKEAMVENVAGRR